jgi:hypothetical protein
MDVDDNDCYASYEKSRTIDPQAHLDCREISLVKVVMKALWTKDVPKRLHPKVKKSMTPSARQPGMFQDDSESSGISYSGKCNALLCCAP